MNQLGKKQIDVNFYPRSPSPPPFVFRVQHNSYITAVFPLTNWGCQSPSASPNAFWVQVFKRHPQTHRFGKSETKPLQTLRPGWVVGRFMVFIHLQVRTSFSCMSHFPKKSNTRLYPKFVLFQKATFFCQQKLPGEHFRWQKLLYPKISRILPVNHRIFCPITGHEHPKVLPPKRGHIPKTQIMSLGGLIFSTVRTVEWIPEGT